MEKKTCLWRVDKGGALIVGCNLELRLPVIVQHVVMDHTKRCAWCGGEVVAPKTHAEIAAEIIDRLFKGIPEDTILALVARDKEESLHDRRNIVRDYGGWSRGAAAGIISRYLDLYFTEPEKDL